MAGINTLFKIAEGQGVTIPELVKFLASPAGYVVSKALDKIEYESQLPSGLLSTLQNPTGAAADYVKTQAKNTLFDENKTSKIEDIISELQSANPNKPNYVGPQEEDSPVSSKNLSDLLAVLNKSPNSQVNNTNTTANTDAVVSNNTNSFVPSSSSNSVGPTIQDSADNNDYSANLTSLLAMLNQYRQPETVQNPEVVSQNSPVIESAPSTETPIDFGGTMDYSDVFGGGYGGGGGGGKYDYDFSSMAYKHGGKICGCK